MCARLRYKQETGASFKSVVPPLNNLDTLHGRQRPAGSIIDRSINEHYFVYKEAKVNIDDDINAIATMLASSC